MKARPTPPAPPAKPPRPKRRRPLKHGGRLRGLGWWLDPRSTGPCPLCKRGLPHRTAEDRSYHGIIKFARRGWLARWRRDPEGVRRWAIERLTPAACEARSRRATLRRMAIVREECPRQAELLGEEWLRRIVAQFDAQSGRNSLDEFRRQVQLHVAGQPNRIHEHIRRVNAMLTTEQRRAAARLAHERRRARKAR